MRRDLWQGFTLFEVILALMLSSVALFTARLLMGQSENAKNRLEDGIALRDQNANGLRLARRLSANAYQESDSTKRVEGNGDQVAFQSWCQSLIDTWTRCRVRLWTQRGASTTDLYVTDQIPGPVLVATLVGDAKLAYLSRDGLDDRWFSEWSGRTDTPLALAFASVRDTITLALGYR